MAVPVVGARHHPPGPEHDGRVPVVGPSGVPAREDVARPQPPEQCGIVPHLRAALMALRWKGAKPSGSC